jgi:hypothetical protein
MLCTDAIQQQHRPRVSFWFLTSPKKIKNKQNKFSAFSAYSFLFLEKFAEFFFTEPPPPPTRASERAERGGGFGVFVYVWGEACIKKLPLFT